MLRETLIVTGATSGEVSQLVCTHHYSRTMPPNVQRAFAWRSPGGLFGDSGEPLAAAVFGISVNQNWPRDALELQRLVRRPDLKRPLTEFLSLVFRTIRATSSTPFVFSYADTGQNHHGGIYQAAGFVYVGKTKVWPGQYYQAADGSLIHGRSVNRRFGTAKHAEIAKLRPDWRPVAAFPKHLYVLPLRQHLKPLLRRFGWSALPYPKSAARPLDESVPTLVSDVQPVGAAP